jgi:hypothetical protein
MIVGICATRRSYSDITRDAAESCCDYLNFLNSSHAVRQRDDTESVPVCSFDTINDLYVESVCKPCAGFEAFLLRISISY